MSIHLISLFPRKGGVKGDLRHLGSVACADWNCPFGSAFDPKLDKKEVTAYLACKAVTL